MPLSTRGQTSMWVNVWPMHVASQRTHVRTLYQYIIAAHYQRALASAHAHATMAAAQTSSAVSRACSRSTADALSARSAADARSRSSLSALSALSRSA
jgi:hypothetical protein